MCTSYRMGSTFRRAGSASRDSRPSRRRCAMPSSQLPASASGACRSVISWLPEKRYRGGAFFARIRYTAGVAPTLGLGRTVDREFRCCAGRIGRRAALELGICLALAPRLALAQTDAARERPREDDLLVAIGETPSEPLKR